ncbi:hypothetical protein gpAD87_18890 [Paenibacillus sp. AD87]|nr:hypothetical protein gpAD87_18890 [Paenibacillus sp. AD87]
MMKPQGNVQAVFIDRDGTIGVQVILFIREISDYTHKLKKQLCI